MDWIDNIEVTPNDWTPEEDSIIKVLGVGGGGCNAVNYMYNQKIEGCTFIVCNTDSQALNKCDVPVKIQLGEGLGAGTNPREGRNAALASQDVIASTVLTPKTQMLFITAGMGGGTGTGAAPVIAAQAHEKGILTVGVVTIPFRTQGAETMQKALEGINELEKNVDSLLIIDNEKLLDEYGDILLQKAFPKADEVLATAVRGITEIIQKKGYINVDFKDVRNMMKDSGYALMGCGVGTGEDRIETAVEGAVKSPLLNNYDLTTAREFLVNITVGNNEQGMTASQYRKVNELIKLHTGKANNFKSGLVFDDDPDFGDKISITVIVTGIKVDILPTHDPENIITIDERFTYSGNSGYEGYEIRDIRNEKIGYNNAAGRKKDLFADGVKPVLLTGDGQNISELEHVTALRRKSPAGARRN